MIKFTEIYNVNPKGRKVGDCVVRAISYAACQSWEDTLEGLFKVALKKKSELACKDVFEVYLEQLGFIKCSQPRKMDNTKYLVHEIDEVVDTNYFDLVINVANHLTCVDGNELIDIWDCRAKSVGNYWIRKKTNNSRPANNAKHKEVKRRVF